MIGDISRWVIVKAARVYKGGPGFSGNLTCSNAGVTPGKIYTERGEALLDATKLARHDKEDFRVTRYKEEESNMEIDKRVFLDIIDNLYEVQMSEAERLIRSASTDVLHMLSIVGHQANNMAHEEADVRGMRLSTLRKIKSEED